MSDSTSRCLEEFDAALRRLRGAWQLISEEFESSGKARFDEVRMRPILVASGRVHATAREFIEVLDRMNLK